MRTLFIYGIYSAFGFCLMFLFHIDYFPPLPERIMATILFWIFVWAISVTQVVGVGKLLRRQRNE